MVYLLKAVWWGLKFAWKTFLFVVKRPVLAIVVGLSGIGVGAWMGTYEGTTYDYTSKFFYFVGFAFLQWGIGAWAGATLGRGIAAALETAGGYVGTLVQIFEWMAAPYRWMRAVYPKGLIGI